MAVLDLLLADAPAMAVYTNVPALRTAVLDVIAQSLSLEPSVDDFVTNTGDLSCLFRLKGTVPIFYQGAQYNIPIVMWLSEDFPASPPRLVPCQQ